MDAVTYSIPIGLLEAYDGRDVIVRAEQAGQVVALQADLLDNVVCVQLTSSGSDLGDLRGWAKGMPLDLVMRDPAADFPELYKWSELLTTHPVRTTVGVVPGFSKAVRLAASLGFTVKLDVAQPDAPLVEELFDVLDLYLHRSSVTEPIEFFHSLLLGWCHAEPATLWAIQEEDPAEFRYVTHEGQEVISQRCADLMLDGDPDAFVEGQKQKVLAEKLECAACGFLEICCGYFKWPDRKFCCDGVRPLLKNLHEAANELRQDLDACERAEAEDNE